MKIVSLLALLACSATLAPLAEAQSAAAPASESPAAASLQHRVALVDMPFIFKNYNKFDALTSSLRQAVEESDVHTRARLEQMQSLQARLTDGTLVEGSLEHQQIEAQLIKLQTEVQSARQVDQRDFLTKEAEIYKTVYLEVQDAVALYARHYKYTLVLQFSRPQIEEVTAPNEIAEQIGNPVVFHATEHDVSDAILSYLNDRWEKLQSEAASARPAK